MELKLRNGYIQYVELDFVNCHMKGVLCFFKIFELKGGDLIMFEYFGHCKFNVYIIGTDCSEIRYPDIVNYLPGIGEYSIPFKFIFLLFIEEFVYIVNLNSVCKLQLPWAMMVGGLSLLVLELMQL